LQPRVRGAGADEDQGDREGQGGERTAITDEASPFALRSTRNRPRTALHLRCQSAVKGSGRWLRVHAMDCRPGSLPEICQKLRHTQPHVPTPRRLQQHGSPWGLRGDMRSRGVVRTTRASMVRMGSPVRFRRGGSTTNQQLRPGTCQACRTPGRPAAAVCRSFASPICTL